jgi:transposase
MTVPGVGSVEALSFKVGVDGPLRFIRSRTVGAHFGLTPRRRQSGTSIDYEGQSVRRNDVNVLEVLCEAAASLLMRVRRWSGMSCAIVAIAPKLAGTQRRM